MKTVSTLAMSFGLLVSNLGYSGEAWITHWINAMEIAKPPLQSPIAIQEYTNAINALEPKQIPTHLFLFNERGNIFIKIKDYPRAISDFTFVINQGSATKSEVTEALWGRMQALLACGKAKEFAADCQILKQHEVYIIPHEESEKYFVFEMGPRMQKDKRVQDTFVKTLLRRNSIKMEKDVVFSPSGVGMVKKALPKESLTNIFNKQMAN
ncbi:MAG: hypothetical protein H0W88_06520 [Parachlamydiaceae bacterium]|nr:hypothetical protein [Parachlamydiaceae bacterium]